MPRLKAPFGFAGLWLALAVACSEDGLPEFGELQWEGERVDVWVQEPLEACGGSFEYLDRHAQLLADLARDAGAEVRDRRYSYYWVASSSWEDTPCTNGAFGCAASYDDRIYSLRIPITHELAHVEFGRMNSFLSEGTAHVHGDDFALLPTSDASIPQIIDEAKHQSIAGEDYGLASFFVRHLLDRYGIEMLPIFQQTSRDMGYPDLVDHFARYDIDLETDVQVVQDGKRCSNFGIRIALSECAIEPTPWQNDHLWVGAGSLDCSADDVVGSTDRDAWTIRTFEITEQTQGDYAVTSDAPLSHLSRCDKKLCEGSSDAEAVSGLLLRPGVWRDVKLRPGRYWVRVAQPAGEPRGQSFEVRLKRSEPFMCPPAPELCLFQGDDCGYRRFRCGTSCVSETWLCDGKVDCEGGSDEADETCSAG